MELPGSVQILIFEYLCETEETCLQIIEKNQKIHYFSLHLDPHLTDLNSRTILCRAYLYRWVHITPPCCNSYRTNISFAYIKEQTRWVKVTQHLRGRYRIVTQDPLQYYSSLFKLLNSIASSDLLNTCKLLGVKDKFVYLT